MGIIYETGYETCAKSVRCLGVGESRVCQLHSQAVARLRSMLEEH